MLETLLQKIPNVLSFLRIGLSPLSAFLAWRSEWAAAFVLFLISVSTDLFDGAIARRLGVAGSPFGTKLDSIADFITQVSLVLGLAFGGIWSWWWVIGLALFNALLDLSRRVLRKQSFPWSLAHVTQASFSIGLTVIPLAVYAHLVLGEEATLFYLSAAVVGLIIARTKWHRMVTFWRQGFDP